MIECKNCGNELNKKQKSFCSANCKNKFQTKNKKPQTCEVCKMNILIKIVNFVQ